MKLVASRILNHPSSGDLARLPDGKVVMLTGGDGETHLEAYNANLEPVWSKRIEYATTLTAAADGTLQVLNATGASTFSERGDLLARTEIRRHEGLVLKAFVPVDNGFVFAWHERAWRPDNDVTRPVSEPILERVNIDGTVSWSITLPIMNLTYKGIMQRWAEEDFIPRPIDRPWMPVSWLCPWRILTVSGDAVLACFGDMAGSGIGFGYIVSLSDGVLRFMTEHGPISEVAALGGGAFLVGYQGYSSFETLRYERDGRVQMRWPSQGHYVITGEDVRVIECSNHTSSRLHLARLLPDGSVAKGARLYGTDASPPFLRADGTLFFVREGAVLAVGDLSIKERLKLRPPDDSYHSYAVAGDDTGIYIADPTKSGRTCLVRIALRSRYRLWRWP
jgi:hypothetical protein